MKLEQIGTDFSLDELKKLASEEEFEDIKDIAIENAENLLEVESEPIELEDRRRSGASGGEYDGPNRKATVDEPSSEGDYSTEYLQSEGIFEEVFHIIGYNEAHKKRNGEIRKPQEERNFGEDIADEVIGGLARWFTAFDFERSLKKADSDLKHITEKEPDKLTDSDYKRGYGATHHFLGYSISKAAKEDNRDAADIAAMSYEEILEEFSNELSTAREELANKYGVHVDLEGEYSDPEEVSEEVQNPGFYIEPEDSEVLVGLGRYPEAEAEAAWFEFRKGQLDYLPTIE